MRPTLSLALLTLVSCVDGPAATPPGIPYGAYELGTAWPKNDLVVCWMPEVYDATDLEIANLRSVAELTVLREWGRVGRIRFNNLWPSCKFVPEADIRIGFDHVNAGRSEIGTRALLVPPDQPTMTLDFDGATGGCPPGPGNACPASATRAADEADFTWVVLHEFGHALGLRHEHARADSTCHMTDEVLDEDGFDGEPLWSFDTSSVMNYCAEFQGDSDRARLSAGDIRALHTIYPGQVGLFAATDFGTLESGPGTWVGPGYYTRATLPALATTSSFVVPAGTQVTACTSTTCAVFSASTRALPATFDNHIQNLAVSPAVVLARDVGFIGATVRLDPGLFRASTGGLGTVGDNQASSAFVPATRVAALCPGDTGTGTCFVSSGGSAPTSIALPAGFDNTISSVVVTPVVETYSDPQFRGDSHTLGTGTYRFSTGTTWLPGVRALAISGLHVVACTTEGSAPLFHGGGTCHTYDQSPIPSIDVLTNLHYLAITTPIVVAP